MEYWNDGRIERLKGKGTILKHGMVEARTDEILEKPINEKSNKEEVRTKKKLRTGEP